MCGIVGYIGQQAASDILVEGLKRLEYRGYDSAGIAISNAGTLDLRREVGKLRNLEAQLASVERTVTSASPLGARSVDPTMPRVMHRS